MSRKYKAPDPTLSDVLAALPKAPSPFSWRLAYTPAQGPGSRALACVELVYNAPGRHPCVFKRWGRGVATGSRSDPVAGLLLGAHQAALYLEALSWRDLELLAAWEADCPRVLEGAAPRMGTA